MTFAISTENLDSAMKIRLGAQASLLANQNAFPSSCVSIAHGVFRIAFIV
jgi:hypothetical protein